MLTSSVNVGQYCTHFSAPSNKFNAILHVRESRTWEFSGGNEKDDLKHLDLVLIDEKVANLISGVVF